MSGQQPFPKVYERIMRRIAEKGFNNGCFHQFAALMQGMIPPERNPDQPPSSSFSCEQLLEGIVQQLSVTIDDAATVAQSFLDARLLVPYNGKLSDSNVRFRPDCSYVMTKKAVKALIDVEHSRILTGDELSNLHDYQINTHLMYLDRTASGKISLGMNATIIMFRLFAGDETVKVNPPTTGSEAMTGMKSPDLSRNRRTSSTDENGVPMRDRQHFLKKFSYTFTGAEAIDWLLEHVAIASRDEGLFLVSHFMSLGWLTNMNGEEVVRDQKNAVYYLTHKGLQELGWADPNSEPGTPNRLSVAAAARKKKPGSGDLHISTENLAKFDDFVRRSEHSDTVDSGWKGRNAHRGSVDMESRNQMPKSQSSTKGRPLSAMIQEWENRGRSITASPGGRAKSKRSATVTEGGDQQQRPASADIRSSTTARDSSAAASSPINFADFFARESRGARLNQILESDEMLPSFRKFVQSMYCEENLEFWLQTESFRTTYYSLFSSKNRRSTSWSLDNRTSAIPEEHSAAELPETDDLIVIERRQQMIAHAILLYRKFIKTESKFEVNNPSSIRREIEAIVDNARQYFDLINNDSASTLAEPTVNEFLAPGVQFSQLPSSLPGFHNNMFKSAHIHIFRLMATDSLPKYMRTDEYRTLFTSLVERGIIMVETPASKRPSQSQIPVETPASKRPSQSQIPAETQSGTSEAITKQPESANKLRDISTGNYVVAPASGLPLVHEKIRNSTSDKVTPRSASDTEEIASVDTTKTEPIGAGTISAS